MLQFLNMDLDIANDFVKNELLENDGEIYFLSQKGVELFCRTAQENYLPLEAGIFSGSPQTEAFRCELKFFLDKGHIQRWGFKEYEAPFCIPVPDISGAELYEIRNDKIIWNYPESPEFKRMFKDFPDTGIPARKIKAPSREIISDWLNNNVKKIRSVEFDLIYKCHYDYMDYAEFEPQPGDLWNLLNTSRFVFSIVPKSSSQDLNFYLNRIGEFQMFLEMQRHLYLPGYTDKDSQDQSVANLLLFAFSSEKEAAECVEILKPYSEFLTGSAAPFEVWGISLESLRNHQGNSAEVISDLLPYVSHPLARIKNYHD